MRRILCWYAALSLLFTFPGILAGQGQGHGHGRGKHRDEAGYSYNDRDRDIIREWYRDQGGNLPPGLAKKDRLPPGLEKQLERRGTLPPGLQKKIRPLPVDLERRLPPPPPGYAHTIISGHIVLLNRKTYAVLDVFHIEP
jgi:hypothetical protein